MLSISNFITNLLFLFNINIYEHIDKNLLAEREKQARIKVELEEARRKQFADRDHMLTQQAKAERDDFLRII